MATIEFLGGAETVIGSKFLLEAGGRRLLVDCGHVAGLTLPRQFTASSPPGQIGHDDD